MPKRSTRRSPSPRRAAWQLSAFSILNPSLNRIGHGLPQRDGDGPLSAGHPADGGEEEEDPPERRRPPVPGEDGDVAFPGGDGAARLGDHGVGESAGVGVGEEDDLGAGVADSDVHGVPFALVGLDAEAGDGVAAGLVPGVVGGPVVDDDDLGEPGVGCGNVEDPADSAFLVESGHDGCYSARHCEGRT